MYHRFPKNSPIGYNHDINESLTLPIANSIGLQIQSYKNAKYPELLKILEPCGFIHSTIPPYDFSISQLSEELLFYEFFEIFANFNIPITSVKNVSPKSTLFNYLNYKHIPFTTDACDFIFFDINKKSNIIKEIWNQPPNGSIIIKALCSNETTELIYFLTTVYDVFIYRPKITIHEYLFIVCQNYTNNYTSIDFNMNIYSNIPLHFLNTMNDFYAIIHQRFLYYQSQVIYYLLNDNEKIKELKSKNILNSVKWCEKYGIPFNNIKINIFSGKVILN